MLKLLVTGASGLLGSQIYYDFNSSYDVFGIVNKHSNKFIKQLKLDLTSYPDVKKNLTDINPDIVIHCAAMTNVDTCEKEAELAVTTNSLATKSLLSCVSNTCKFIYVSTDAVFDGESGNYDENCVPNPINNYARTKLKAEEYVKFFKNHTIIRSNFFGYNKNFNSSFFNWLINSLKEQKPINMFTDVVSSPLSTISVSSMLLRLINLDFCGLLHVGSCDNISKFRIGQEIASFFGLDKNLINPINLEEFNFVARRPKNTTLNIKKSVEILNVEFSVLDEIKKVRI